MNDQLDRVEKKLDKICLAIFGDPADEESIGLKGKVDRLEQTDKARTWWTRTAVGAALGALATAVSSRLGL